MFSIGTQLVPNFATQEHPLQVLERALAEQPTVLVIDNMESVQEGLDELLQLCATLGAAGHTRLIFTSRESIPAPFGENVVRIGRLDRETAIRLLGNLLPDAPESDETEEDLENLVDAVGGHAAAWS